MSNQLDAWPAGATWVFQGTVAEDATGGTHNCTLTITPGAGNEIQMLYGKIVVGATATSQVAIVAVDDGANGLGDLVRVAGTTSGIAYNFPSDETALSGVGVGAVDQINNVVPGFLVSGTMRLILTVQTTAVSVTQTFAVVCRIKGAVPTAALADTVGTPVLTTNTSKVF